jgi:NAD(P)-dependent dehydrogenase (short-subunit alcohol dehydrogenase family)
MRRVCLLTGASGRFGNAFCRTFSDRYEIAGVFHRHPPDVTHAQSRFIDPLAPTVELVENENPLFAIRADLRRPEEHERILELTFARFGQIDLVINAAVMSKWGSMVNSRQLAESIEDQFQLSVFTPFRICTLLMRRYWRLDVPTNRALNRNIVNLSSTAATQLYAGQGQSVYAAAKAALNTLTAHMADEFGLYGIRVNALSPDRFDAKVPLATVLREVVKLDEGNGTGEIIEVRH